VTYVRICDECGNQMADGGSLISTTNNTPANAEGVQPPAQADFCSAQCAANYFTALVPPEAPEA
jgi:hypothetical protein